MALQNKVKLLPRLIARNLPFEFGEDKLKELFGSYGDLKETSIPLKNGKKQGFGFIRFRTLPQAKKALEEMNGKVFRGRKIVLDWSIPKAVYQQSNEQEEQQAQKKRKKKEELQESSDEEEESEEEEEDDDDEEDEDEDEEDEDEDEGEESEEGESDVEEEEEVDDEEEEDDDDEDEDEEIEAKEEKSNKESKKKAKEKKDHHQPIGQNDHLESALFVRNMGIDSTREGLKNVMQEFGKVKGVYLVRNPETGLSRGCAFVHFETEEAANAVLERAYSFTVGENIDFASTKLEGSVLLDGRRLIINKAVSRDQINDLKAQRRKKKEKEDNRNLYLAEEGVIKPTDPAAKEMSQNDLKKRQRAQVEKKKKLRNPNYWVSKTRLSIKNLPRSYTEKDLRQMYRKASNNAKMKQVKIVFDEKGVSRGFGFVEFYDHEPALLALRETNNNPSYFGPNARPIVEFAVDDVKKLLHRQHRINNQKKKQESGESSEVEKKISEKKGKRKEEPNENGKQKKSKSKGESNGTSLNTKAPEKNGKTKKHQKKAIQQSEKQITPQELGDKKKEKKQQQQQQSQQQSQQPQKSTTKKRKAEETNRKNKRQKHQEEKKDNFEMLVDNYKQKYFSSANVSDFMNN